MMEGTSVLSRDFSLWKYPTSRLGEVCEVKDGTHESPKYVVSGTGFPLVTSKNLASGTVDLRDVNYISRVDFNSINQRSKVDKGDILMPMIGTIGNPVLVTDSPNYAIKNVALIKFDEKSPCNEYVLRALSSSYFSDVFTSSARGGTQQFISLGDIRDFINHWC